jgi:hypothetical protein
MCSEGRAISLHSSAFSCDGTFIGCQWYHWYDASRVAFRTISNVRKKQNQDVDLRETALDTHEYLANGFSESSMAAASAYLNLVQASRPEKSISGLRKIATITSVFVKSICFPLDSCSVQKFLHL